jgi:hypothetical protein
MYLIPRLYKPGSLIHRQAIVSNIMDYHLENGGKNSKAGPVGQAKRALHQLVQLGVVEQSVGYGYWRIVGTTSDTPKNPDPVTRTLTIPLDQLEDGDGLVVTVTIQPGRQRPAFSDSPSV